MPNRFFNRSIVKFVFLVAVSVLWALVLSPAGFFSLTMLALSALPMRIARRSFGAVRYWLAFLSAGSALAVFGPVLFGLAFLSVVILIGAYAEIESHVDSVFSSGLLSVAVTTGGVFSATALWLSQVKTDLIGIARAELKAVLEGLQASGATTSINVEALLQQLPSAVLALFMLSLAASLVWERRAYAWFGLPAVERVHGNLTSFRVPDVFVWITMAAILGAFLQHGKPWLEAVSLNVINIVVLLYLFQGLAIVATFFRMLKVSPVWQGFWYFLIAVQMFPVVSLLGFVDFWMDFRERIARKPTEMKKSI